MLSELIQKKFAKFVIATHHFRGDDTVILKREGLLEVARFLKEDPEADCNCLMVGKDQHPRLGNRLPKRRLGLNRGYIHIIQPFGYNLDPKNWCVDTPGRGNV